MRKVLLLATFMVLRIEFTSAQEYTLVWSDEFDQEGAPNLDNWHFQTFAPANGSWFNGEEQHYTDRIENAYIEGGFLKIVAKKETYNNGQSTKQYTSARLNSKYAFTYGRVDVRAKLPEGRGTWPAIWTLGQNVNEAGGYWQTQGFATTNWPATGEIDIMEHWGDSPDIIHWSNHTPAGFGGNPNTNKGVISNVSSEFHEYSIIWDEEKITYLVDDVIKHIYNPSNKNDDNWPFYEPQYLLLNVAMGGIFQSEPRRIDPDFVESAMEIDYVRVFEESIPAMQDARLKDIQIDGQSIIGFNSNSSNYTYFLNQEQQEIPPVTYEKNQEGATVIQNEAESIPGKTTLEVTSQDGSMTKVYIIEFKRPFALPTDFESEEISYSFVNFDGGVGELIDNPDPEPFNNSNTVMKYTKFEGAPFAGTVLPLDQSINFSDGSLLKAKVNAPRAGASLTFKLESPTGSNEVVVTNKKISEWELMVFDFSGMEKEDYNAITLIWDNGTAGAGTSDWVFLMDEIEVRDQINTGSTLASLSINDTLVTSFNSDVLMYSFELPVDLTDIPLITAVPVDERAIVDIQTPSTIPGTVEILVIAEDGENQTQYAVALSAKEAPLNVAEEFVLLHPNPASDRIYLQSDLQIKADDLKLFDLSGQVYPVEWKEDRVGISGNISSLPSGIYFVSFGDRSAGYKFLKNR